MKKLSILLILFALFSCSKVEESYIKYRTLNLENTNSNYKVLYSNYNVNLEVKINDSTFRGFSLSTVHTSKKGYIYLKTINKGRTTITTVEKDLTGSHTINNNIINGRYTSKNSSDFIEFKNYQL